MMTTRQVFEEAYEKANGDYHYIRIRPDLSVGDGPIKNLRHIQVLLNLDSIFLVFLQADEVTIMKDNRPSHWEPFKFESKTGTALKPLPAYARSTFESACELREGQPYYVYLREDLSVGQGPIRDLAHAKALPTMDGVFLVFVEYGKISVVKDNRPAHWEPFKFEKKRDWSSPINKELVASEAVRILRDLASPMEFSGPKTAGGWFGDRPTHLTVPAKKGEAAFTVEDRKAVAGKELDKLVEARVAVRQWVKF